MSEQTHIQADRESDTTGYDVTRSILGPESATYAWGEVVVAAVDGATTTFFDGDTEPEICDYPTPDHAHYAALQYAWSFEDARRALAEAR
jgi:hypothetical protein